MMQSSVWKECLQGLMGNGLENTNPAYRKAFDDICGAMTDQVAFAGIVGKVNEMNTKICGINKTIHDAGVQAKKALNYANQAASKVDDQYKKINSQLKKVEQLVHMKDDLKLDDRAMGAALLFDNILERGSKVCRLDTQQLIRTAGNICYAYLMGGNAVVIKNDDLNMAIDGLKAVADTNKTGGKKF